MSIEQQIAKLIADTRGALTRSNGKPLSASVDELERIVGNLQTSINTVSKQLGRPRSGGDGDGLDERTLATRWLQCKSLADNPRRGSLQNFTPSSDLVDQAVLARSALTKALTLQQLDASEQKALSLFNMGSSGYFCPPEWSAKILSCIQESSDVLGFVFSQVIGSASLNFFVDHATLEAVWACETDCGPPPGGTDIASQLGALEVAAGEMRLPPICATRSFLEDSAIDVESWLMGKATKAFRRSLADAVMIGSGQKMPLGILRAGIPVIETATPPTPAGQFVWQDLVMLFATLPAAYRANSAWVMNSITLGLMLTMSDTNGRPMVLPSLTGPVPLSLLGRPILVDERMPNVAVGATPILLADLRELYITVIRSGPTMLPPIQSYCVQFLFLQRAGGAIACPNAGLLLRIT